MSRAALRDPRSGAVPPSSKADAARPATPPSLVDERVLDQVLSILKSGPGLDVRAHAVRSAMQCKPDRDHVLAAKTVVEWASQPGGIRNREAGVLLAYALKTQQQSFFHRAMRWAARELPDEHPPFVAWSCQLLRDRREPINPDTVMASLRRQGKDRATLFPEEAQAS